MTNLTAIPQVPNSLKVSWLSPATDCFQFTTFDVRCISNSGGSNSTFQASGAVRMASVSGLTPNTSYSCDVTSSLADISGYSFRHRTISDPVESSTFPACKLSSPEDSSGTSRLGDSVILTCKFVLEGCFISRKQCATNW